MRMNESKGVDNADGSNFENLFPSGLRFVIPTDVPPPIATCFCNGLTSFTSNDVKTGKICTRFDLNHVVLINKYYQAHPVEFLEEIIGIELLERKCGVKNV